MKPRADSCQRIQLGVIRQNYTATREPTGFPHDRPPVTEEPFQISTTRPTATGNGCETFLWEVQNDVLNTLDLVIVVRFHYARLLICESLG